MATKPQPVPWEELNDLRFDLFEWLVEQRLAKPRAKPLAAAFKLQSDPRALTKLNAEVVEALLEVELFAGARNRADGDTKRLKELPDDVRELFFDDRVEREADQAMRALLPSIRHIERLLEKTAERRAKRARAVGIAAKDARTDDLEAVVQSQAQLVGRQARLMHRVFLELHPSVPPEDLTLMGYRRLERRIRKRLLGAGFPAEKRDPSRLSTSGACPSRKPGQNERGALAGLARHHRLAAVEAAMHDFEYLLLDEIAAIARASVDTVRRWIRSGQLPSVKPGRRRLVRRGDLERFLARDTLIERRALSDSAASPLGASAPDEGTGNG